MYPADHLPPHVHVVKAGAGVKIALGEGDAGPWIVTVYGMRTREVLSAFRLVERHCEYLRAAWKEYHE